MTLPRLIASDAVNLAGQDTGRRHLSASQLSTILACPQRFDFHYEQGLRLKSKPAPLALGAAFQIGIEKQSASAGMEALLSERSQLYADDETKAKTDAAVVGAAVGAYLDAYGIQRFESREVEFLTRLRNPWTGAFSRTFDLLGRVDGVYSVGDQLGIIENKFVGQINGQMVRRLPLDRALAIYSYGLWRATGREVVEVRYRLTKKPAIRQKQGESVDEFCARVAEDYTARPESYLHEEVLARSSDDLVRTEAELWTWAQQLRDFATYKLYPRNTSSCHDFGGCAFLPLCLGDADAQALYELSESKSQSLEAAA